MRSPPGSFSGQMDGSALNIQYGGSAPPTGRRSEPPGSLPIDPYLKCSVMSSYSVGRCVSLSRSPTTHERASSTPIRIRR